MEETTMQKTERTERQDVYTRITAQIVADLEKGVRPWVKIAVCQTETKIPKLYVLSVK
jgi:antirestriction protein ArdC